MRKVLAAILPSLLLTALVVHAALPVPRQAPDFTIKMPGQQPVSLASLKGKVVVVQFLDTNCSHCQATAQMLSKVKADFAAKGVEIYGVAFNPGVLTASEAANTAEVRKFTTQFARFPVGIAERNPVLKYLGLSPMERWGVPQIVVIDKKGIIQAQSKGSEGGVEPLQHEPSLRNLLTMLVNK
jgi:cytochrome c biogenesis protein CcmG/thiol:disulfide interchange protein DsbE